jgi:hypothetical protein
MQLYSAPADVQCRHRCAGHNVRIGRKDADMWCRGRHMPQAVQGDVQSLIPKGPGYMAPNPRAPRPQVCLRAIWRAASSGPPSS